MTSSNLTNLKQAIVSKAHAELRRAHPRYVSAFQDRMQETQGNLDEAIAASDPLRANGMPRWSELLTTLFDMNLLALKVDASLQRLQSAQQDADPESFHYHLDHWTFQFDAYLERSDKALAQSLRQLLGRTPVELAVQKSVRHEMAEMRKAIGEIRNGLAHGGGDGVSAITHYWLPFLGMEDPLTFDQIFIETVQASSDVRDESVRMAQHLGIVNYCSAAAFARIESLAGTILRSLVTTHS